MDYVPFRTYKFKFAFYPRTRLYLSYFADILNYQIRIQYSKESTNLYENFPVWYFAPLTL